MASRTLEAASMGRPQPRRRFASVTLFFTQTITLKVWLAIAAVALALFQGASALRIYGKTGRGTADA